MNSPLAARVQRLQLRALARSHCSPPPDPAQAEDLRRAVHTMLAAGCRPEEAAGLADRIGTQAETQRDRALVAAIDGEAAARACGTLTDFLRLVGRLDAAA